jgi:hypothetical protein
MLTGRVSRPSGETIETAKQMAGHEFPEQMDSMPAGRMEGEGFSTREAFPFYVILFSGPVFGGVRAGRECDGFMGAVDL